MSYANYKRLTDLRYLLADLGKRGGLISPSVYDTAQVFRLTPRNEQNIAVLGWLIGQQHPDGGWGSPIAPLARDLPTLAALLALQPYAAYADCCASIEAGLAFLRTHASQHWEGPLSDDLPVGVELLLPRLLNEAVQSGLDLSVAPYTPLIALGNQCRQLIASQLLGQGSPLAHWWEGWGSEVALAIIDGSGGVGHSPAATAAWLQLTAERPEFATMRVNAQHFVAAASAATCLRLPGMVPTIWPVGRFEQVWALYTLFVAGLLNHPHLEDLVHPQLDSLFAALRPAGIGMSDYFTPDGDMTATTLAILKAAGYGVDHTMLYRFQAGDHFFLYPHNLQPSLTTTAHAVLALALAGEDVSRPARFLNDQLTPDGRWVGDNQHFSWLYTTSQVVTALAHARQFDVIVPAVGAILRAQRTDGGWGIAHSTTAETAYAALALHAVRMYPQLETRVQDALERAADWLVGYYDLSSLGEEVYWIGKELYCPYRVDHAYALSAVLALTAPPEVARARGV